MGTLYEKKWYVMQGIPPMTRSGWEVTNRSGTKESYWFETKEWAEFCAEHFNRLEDIVPQKTIRVTALGDALSCVGFHKEHVPSQWTCYFTDSFRYTPSEGKEPNAFQRKMQELMFGFKWVKK
jgi:hypothetical protein